MQIFRGNFRKKADFVRCSSQFKAELQFRKSFEFENVVSYKPSLSNFLLDCFLKTLEVTS
jgi:hypothetical protein